MPQKGDLKDLSGKKVRPEPLTSTESPTASTKPQLTRMKSRRLVTGRRLSLSQNVVRNLAHHSSVMKAEVFTIMLGEVFLAALAIAGYVLAIVGIETIRTRNLLDNKGEYIFKPNTCDTTWCFRTYVPPALVENMKIVLTAMTVLLVVIVLKKQHTGFKLLQEKTIIPPRMPFTSSTQVVIFLVTLRF
jgi:hypothetical protein